MQNQTNTHPLNVGYLVVGLVFLGIAGTWALLQSGLVEVGEAEWLLPMTLVAAGVIGLVATAAKGMSGRRDRTGAVDHTVDHTDGHLFDDNDGDLR